MPLNSSLLSSQVFVRIRPEIPEDAVLSEMHARSQPIKCIGLIDDKTLRVDPPESVGRKSVAAVDSKLFSYDRIFGEEAQQEHIYQCVSHHVRATIRGYNTTIFALGCTGSGRPLAP